MTDNLALWDSLKKTDPAHTKPFNRAGGFKGTAVKPIYVIKKLTEQLGPCGIGWGMGKPDFQVVPCESEVLVFCTVECWHGSRDNVLYGVGGDKVQAKRSSGAFCDDEAFKKAFTDAVNNAFKFIGVSADVHMGQFDDDKYVTALKHEIAEQNAPPAPKPTDKISDETRDWISDKLNTRQLIVGDLCADMKVNSLKELTYSQVEAVKNWIRDNTKEAA